MVMRPIGLVGYSPPHPVNAIAFLLGQSLVMLMLSLLLDTHLAPITGADGTGINRLVRVGAFPPREGPGPNPVGHTR